MPYGPFTRSSMSSNSSSSATESLSLAILRPITEKPATAASFANVWSRRKSLSATDTPFAAEISVGKFGATAWATFPFHNRSSAFLTAQPCTIRALHPGNRSGLRFKTWLRRPVRAYTRSHQDLGRARSAAAKFLLINLPHIEFVSPLSVEARRDRRRWPKPPIPPNPQHLSL